ncbi:hypothetical protein GSI_10764 [Ganoderma sinense ZZ0214-1]|uniref:Uncharacterized protein n=1 Tax=Ganoderma sinense ZZ0214-1 TaxID=1077348 RepID=A0A2G8S1G5_9APHY|nr:hypothetical protein GSI_10764 [Ganoderma sinense ZZ0214-1]
MLLEDLDADGAPAIIISNVVEIVFFGIYSIFFMFAIIILVVYKKPLPVDWLMVITTCVVYVSCMAHTSILTTDRHTTFTSGLPIPSGEEMSGLLRVTDMEFKICGFLSQLVMIHRCWAVWEHRLVVVIVPLAMSLASVTCGLVGPLRIPSTDFKSPWVAPRMQLFDMLSAAISLAVFALVMSLIAYRLRCVLAPLRNVQSMETIIWTLVGASIEAGALLVLAQAAVVVLFLRNSPMIIIVEGIATQIYGIAPTMMIIRIGLSMVPRGRRWDSDSPMFSSLVLSTIYGCEDSSDNASNELVAQQHPELRQRLHPGS